MDFSTEIQYLKGVGPARAEAFSKLGVDTVGALLRFYPRAYEDWSRVVPIREWTAAPGIHPAVNAPSGSVWL